MLTTGLLCFIIIIHTIAESLPISSSGHLKLLQAALGIPSNTFLLSETGIHLLHIPATLVLILFFHKKIIFILKYFKRCIPQMRRLTVLCFVAELPISIGYLILKRYPLLRSPLWLGFLLTALLLISLILRDRIVQIDSRSKVYFFQALIIGIMQTIALLPGISRLGSTYVIGYWLGLTPRSSLLFSLTLELPLLIALSLKTAFDYIPFLSIDSSLVLLILATVIGVTISYSTLLFVMSMAQRGTLWYFGIYMLFPAFMAFFI